MELEPGKLITGIFTIEKISISEHLAEIELNDGTTKIIGLLKDNVDLFSKTYFIGEKVVCKGKVRKRRKNNCLDIIYISKNMLDTQINKKFNSEVYVERFHELVSNVEDPDYKSILDNCFNDDVKELYFTYPAAKGNHHNYVHGLLQHSVEVVDISLFLAKYFKANKDLLICAGLLHDIGKLKSYDVESGFKVIKTDWEGLLGHLTISALFVSRIIHSEVNQNKAMLLYHLILSHHGSLENGSPVVCKTKESYILSKADELSSALNHIDLLSYNGSWSEEDNKTSFKRSWYRGIENV
jgi:putative nucleotidyltransferase with HDIG domain